MKQLVILAIVACVLLTGCASYTTPGRGADFKQLGLTEDGRRMASDPDIRRTLDAKPLAAFPTAIAVARIQAPGYRNYRYSGYGNGKYCVMTTREVETEQQLARISKLPLISGIAPMNRLLLPEQFESDMPLREAAARLHADMLLIYTIDTTFQEDQKAAPVSVITLGLSPTKIVGVTTTASAVLVDTRNSYLYGLAEATVTRNKLTSSWGTEDAIDAARVKNEQEAFEKLVGEFETTWTGVVNRYAVAAK